MNQAPLDRSKGHDDNFADQVRAVLSDTTRLPEKFKEFVVQYPAQNPVPLHTVIAPAHQSTGLGDAIQGTRYVGSTTSGHPTSTTEYFHVGDFVIDLTGDIWICTVAGAPGTWVDVKGTASASLPWMGYENISVSVLGDGTPKTVGMNTGDFDFSDSSIYGSDVSNRPEIKAEGIYQLLCSASFTYPSGTPPANSFADVSLNFGLIAAVNTYNAFLENESGAYTANPGFIQWVNIKAASVPLAEALTLSQTSGTTITAEVSFMVVQTYPTASSIL